MRKAEKSRSTITCIVGRSVTISATSWTIGESIIVWNEESVPKACSRTQTIAMKRWIKATALWFFRLVEMFFKVEFIVIIGIFGRWENWSENDILLVFNKSMISKSFALTCWLSASIILYWDRNKQQLLNYYSEAGLLLSASYNYHGFPHTAGPAVSQPQQQLFHWLKKYPELILLPASFLLSMHPFPGAQNFQQVVFQCWFLLLCLFYHHISNVVLIQRNRKLSRHLSVQNLNDAVEKKLDGTELWTIKYSFTMFNCTHSNCNCSICHNCWMKAYLVWVARTSWYLYFLVRFFNFYYKYPPAFSSDVASNYCPKPRSSRENTTSL